MSGRVASDAIQTGMPVADCPFCKLIAEDTQSRIVQENEHAVAIRDAYPVSPGHTLIIPRRHEGSFFALSKVEQQAVMELLTSQHQLLQSEYQFSDCNVGINDGSSAGQTVPHCHLHLIPRIKGDVEDPRGGVRWIIPDKADYWTR